MVLLNLWYLFNNIVVVLFGIMILIWVLNYFDILLMYIVILVLILLIMLVFCVFVKVVFVVLIVFWLVV